MTPKSSLVTTLMDDNHLMYLSDHSTPEYILESKCMCLQLSNDMSQRFFTSSHTNRYWIFTLTNHYMLIMLTSKEITYNGLSSVPKISTYSWHVFAECFSFAFCGRILSRDPNRNRGEGQ